MSFNSESTVTQLSAPKVSLSSGVSQVRLLNCNEYSRDCWITHLLKWDEGLFLTTLKYKDVSRNGNPLKELQSFFMRPLPFLQSLKILMFAVFSKLPLNNLMEKNYFYRVKPRLEQKVIFFNTSVFKTVNMV